MMIVLANHTTSIFSRQSLECDSSQLFGLVHNALENLFCLCTYIYMHKGICYVCVCVWGGVVYDVGF